MSSPPKIRHVGSPAEGRVLRYIERIPAGLAVFGKKYDGRCKTTDKFQSLHDPYYPNDLLPKFIPVPVSAGAFPAPVNAAVIV